MTVNLDLEVVPRATFVPNSEAQLIVYSSWAPVIAYSGRLGSSKSRTGLEGADYDCRRWAGNRVIFARKRASDLFATTLDIFLNEVLHPEEVGWFRQHGAGGAMVRYPNGSRMLWLGLDDEGKVLSGEFGSAYVDQAEQLDEIEAQALEGRIRLRRARPAVMPDGSLLPLRRRVVYLFNPDADTHWANRRFGFTAMQRAGKLHKITRTTQPTKLISGLIVPAGKPLAEVVIAGRTDNAENLDHQYQLTVLAQYQGPYADRMVGGHWGSFEGQVVPNFREDIHVIDRPAEWDAWGGYPPPWWKRYRSVDFGMVNPFVMSWYARRPEDKADFLYQEIYMTGRLVSDHAKQAKQWDQDELTALNRGLDRWRAENPGHVAPERVRVKELVLEDGRQGWYLPRLSFALQVADHDAEGRATLNDTCGIATDLAIKDKLPRAEIVFERLQLRRLFFVRTARREVDPALVNKHPTCTHEELPGIRWVKPPTSSERSPKEEWAKVDDHGWDQLTYFLLTERERGSMRVVRLGVSSSREDDGDQ